MLGLARRRQDSRSKDVHKWSSRDSAISSFEELSTTWETRSPDHQEDGPQPSKPCTMHRTRLLASLKTLRQPNILSHIRRLHLAPPFLLDDYTPRYQLLSSIDASKKRSAAYAHLRNFNLCPRLCGVNRYEKTGVCLIGAETVKVNVIAPHFGEGE